MTNAFFLGIRNISVSLVISLQTFHSEHWRFGKHLPACHFLSAETLRRNLTKNEIVKRSREERELKKARLEIDHSTGKYNVMMPCPHYSLV